MAFLKPTYNQLAAWAGVFLCTLLVQISLFDTPEEIATLSNSQKNLLQNAVIPIFLSEDRSAATRQLENLIQETDIRQIRIYTSDQQLVTQILNASVPDQLRETQIENIPIVFQGSMAGSVQLDIGYLKVEPNTRKAFLTALSKSALITFIAWVLVYLYLILYKWLLPKLNTRNRQPGVLEEVSNDSPAETGSSLLIYVYPVPDEALKESPDLLRDCLISFSQKLENHLRVYGGRILSVSDNCLVCRMAAGQSQNNMQQALTFCWGIARPMLYREAGNQYQLSIKSLLHQTESPAKSGNLFRAISEVDQKMEQAVLHSQQGAHLTDTVLSTLGPTSNFEHSRSKDHANLHQIISVKKSVDTLWQKQESMVSTTGL